MHAPPDLDVLLTQIAALRDEIDAMRPLSGEQAGRAMQRLRLEWTYHSNAIEGNSLTYGETRALLMHGVTAHGKPLKDHLDIRRHREVIEYLERFVRSDEPLTQHVLREMHRLLMGDEYEVSAETPDGGQVKRTERGGAYKTLPNNVVTETGETHYYTTPEETPALMTDLVDGLRQSDGAHPVVRAALFHHRFVEIHPFPDGNGRTARVLMNLLLMRAGYVPAVIRQERRPAYYGALAAADAGDRQPVVQFVAEELAETMGLYLRALKGEPDPTAFDRRLSLLRHEAKSIPSPLMTDERRSRLSTQFVWPLLESLREQAVKIAYLFLDHDDTLSVWSLEYGEAEGSRARDILLGGDWESFEWVFRLYGLSADPSRSAGFLVSGSVGVSGFVLKATPGQGIERSYKGNSLPGSEDVDPLALEIAEQALDVAADLVRLSRGEQE